MTSKYEELIWTEESVNRFWDWQSKFPENYFTYQFGAEIVAKLVPYISGKIVLDYGCGVGNLLPHLCQSFPSVYAADSSSESLAVVEKKMIGYQNFCGAFSINDLSETEKKFDVVLVMEVIEHLYDAQLNVLLSNIMSVLNEDGIVVFTTPNNEDLSKNMMICPESGKTFHRWQHVRCWNGASLTNYLSGHGLEVSEVIETNFAKKPISGPKSLLKSLVGRLIHGPSGNPHLACIAKRRFESSAKG
ncbi:MAG: class I SAM-dependent methyltransferase [Rhodospirillales bacterium]|nr:class I SAM-dependent methyltransferase [Rhodospirillales bacterium]